MEANHSPLSEFSAKAYRIHVEVKLEVGVGMFLSHYIFVLSSEFGPRDIIFESRIKSPASLPLTPPPRFSDFTSPLFLPAINHEVVVGTMLFKVALGLSWSLPSHGWLTPSLLNRAPTISRALSDDELLQGPAEEPYLIKLDQFLKFVDVANGGGHAKALVAEGEVAVNGLTETRRGRKLREGDQVLVNSETFDVGELVQPRKVKASPKRTPLAARKPPKKATPPAKSLEATKPKAKKTVAKEENALPRMEVTDFYGDDEEYDNDDTVPAEPKNSVAAKANLEEEDWIEGGAFDIDLEDLIAADLKANMNDLGVGDDGDYDDYELGVEDDDLLGAVEDNDSDDDEASTAIYNEISSLEPSPSETTAAKTRAPPGVKARGETKGGLSLTLRRAMPSDLKKVGGLSWAAGAGLPSGSQNTPTEAGQWVLAELTRGFGGVVAVVRAGPPVDSSSSSSSSSSSESDSTDGVVEMTNMVVAPSARQRGVAGAVVDYVVATSTGMDIVARLPPYKNKAAKKAVKGMFENRGVRIPETF